MGSPIGFVVKVFAIATLIAVAIKHLGPTLAIPATPAVSLGLVCLPTLGILGWLGWHWLRS
ncbi:hypothetical protein XM38_043200 [Halomicronema hongdechloris C2206]|uniref:Uncharacterized protein n=1 Tax=Halomicronema hongdechloris C2206 TaxID=1641165 RepID=A0A1Z3HST7_9CYAN|nr:hypothetical protein [Halomicronema hongdechloris]ASC73355.1 hypothetical protein XM38_043200 [Halomicronema hongdechloris C2206]